MGKPNLVPYETIIQTTIGGPEAIEKYSCTKKKQNIFLYIYLPQMINKCIILSIQNQK